MKYESSFKSEADGLEISVLCLGPKTAFSVFAMATPSGMAVL